LLDEQLGFCFKAKLSCSVFAQALALLHYQLWPTVHHVLYNEEGDFVFVDYILHLQPLWNPVFTTELPVLTFMQLENVPETERLTVS
jgi:hypothetical protein